MLWQPQVEIATGRVVAMEALARWCHPRHGAVSPAVFIPIAEATGSIVPLGRHVLDLAIRQLASWQRLHPTLAPPRIAVNLSACQLRDDATLGEWVQERLGAHGVAPGRLELEVTESTLVEHRALAGALLAEMRAGGVRVAIDDFGTGYSNLANLAGLPFDVIKVDRTFVASIGLDPRGTAVTRLILELAERLGAETIAEGVETDDQLAWLARMGATHVQGYRFSEPLDTPGATNVWLRQPWLRAEGLRGVLD
ncbi:MAG: EAL domain-containing protein [Pseudomonadota bacterium]|nr:EAL domain-containing protein [Pseudomonadota bacterium]